MNLYRLQLNASFTFYDAIAILPYLKDLGIDALYCNPIFQAVAGSCHGYDVINPARFNEDIGGEKGFDLFQRLAHELGFKVILDLVANHMAASLENPWWFDVLLHGPYSLYADYFDIDWDSQVLPHKVLVPILDIPSNEALNQEKIILVIERESFCIKAMGKFFPINIEGYNCILEQLLHQKLLKESLQDIAQIVSLLKRIPLKGDVQDKIKRAALFQECRQRLFSQVLTKEECLSEIIKSMNQDKGFLGNLLSKLYFHLELWQFAPQNINYRRFFDINDLAALNMAHRDLFSQYHALAFKLLSEGKVQGLRIDHPDGLYDLEEYFLRLQELYRLSTKDFKAQLPVIVEKILQRSEKLPAQWAVEGSVGYEYLNMLHQLFIKSSEEAHFSHLYETFIEQPINKDLLLQEEKRKFALLYMTADMKMLAFKAQKALSDLKMKETCSLGELEKAIVELYVFFPVYRTYLQQHPSALSQEDQEVLLEVFVRAENSLPDLKSIFNNLRDLFFSQPKTEITWAFIMRFQQLAPCIMAKGFEDTHLYNYNRMISLNEVGSSPHLFGETPQSFHAKILEKQQKHPGGWVTLSTHDTKRGGDNKLRLHVLTECGDIWEKQVLLWKKENKKFKVLVDGKWFPDHNREYFLYQTLVGFWPSKQVDSGEKKQLILRIKDYLIKACRESKIYTTWIHHHTAYEQAMIHFIDAVFKDERGFYTSLCDFVQAIALSGLWNSLSCVNLAAGLPAPLDIYQGTEIGDFNLVDPDNRRPIDYKQRKHLLKQVHDHSFKDDKKTWMSNLIYAQDLDLLKIYLLKTALNARKDYHALFLHGEYIPLKVEGVKQDHVIAYLRRHNKASALIISTRWLFEYKDSSFWEDTAVFLPQTSPNGRFMDIYTNNVCEIHSKSYIKELLSLAPFSIFLEIS